MRENTNVKKLVLTSILLAIVIILQLVASAIPLGQFEFSLVLIPIAIGAILMGPKTGALLGLCFSIIVLLQPGTFYFYGFGYTKTIIIVLTKGTLAGFLTGVIYQSIKNIKGSTIIASLATPIINTSIFALGTIFLLRDAIDDMFEGYLSTCAQEGITPSTENPILFLLLIIIGGNFVVEFIITTILAPAIARICNIAKDNFNI